MILQNKIAKIGDYVYINYKKKIKNEKNKKLGGASPSLPPSLKRPIVFSFETLGTNSAYLKLQGLNALSR